MTQFRVVFAACVILHLLPVYAQKAPREEPCAETTRPHATRCDQYYQCTELSKDAHAWVTTQCQKGLVYMQHLGTCAVPDSEWECDLSAENDQSHSEENVYGIDNLGFPSFSDTLSGSEEDSQEIQISTVSEGERTTLKTPPQLELNDAESSGDGSPEHMGTDEASIGTPETTVSITVSPSTVPITTTTSTSTMSPSQLGSFLAYYDSQNALKLKSKQPPQQMDENNYLQHLKLIVNQQKQLNQMADITKNMNFFTHKAVPMQRQSEKPNPTSTESSAAPPTLSPGMQEIIKNILDISQQAIANQKSSPAAPAKDPVVKPIFIPISVNPVPAASVYVPTTTPEPPKAIVETSTEHLEPLNPMQNVAQTNQRVPTMNGTAFQGYPQILYDAYGNKYVSKDSYQMIPSNYGAPGYNPFMNPTPQFTMLNPPSDPFYPSNTRTSVPNSRPADSVNPYPERVSSSLTEFASPTKDDQGSLRDILDRIKLLESIESAEDDDGDASAERDVPLPTKNKSDDFADAESSDEDNPDGSSTNGKYKRKLFTLGDATFDYDQYKDSMLPLLDANPNDERISVVMCMIGSRQPNNTDCFRYYICNPHNAVFQSYTCPPFTAFNKNSRMCDMSSYKHCKAEMSPPTTARPQLRTRHEPGQKHGSKSHIRSELRKAQKYVELIRLEANKLRLQNNMPTKDQNIIFLPSMDHLTTKVSEPSKVRPKPAVHKKKKTVVAGKKHTTTTVKPQRKVPRCRLEGRMPDPMDQSNYYVCHRKSPKKFIKLKMACPPDLLYCADTQYCTLRTNC